MALQILSLLPFSSDRRVYRSFGHAIVAEPGLVAVAPLSSLDGSLQGMVDGCPVPWTEAWAVIDTPTRSEVDLGGIDFAPAAVKRLAEMDRAGWALGVLPELKAVLFGHDCGLKVAIAADLVFKGDHRHV
ncbi:hypothetical protein [Pseudogulbenkiania ferrooxidans]|uniref:Uncharacterized protein n=1 Tax=Pseudogulbenkiania ferrooxidans 2002 TaxID=279714 RepID=B9Z4W3_9NEIS|nr:hypothetical protein [Pseudogulbenkiania ferrooxidans]EEG08195.1 hypothetical protein FuraDRAFT_2398 [Pseudogulbenkiania ferrooxidans 2002]